MANTPQEKVEMENKESSHGLSAEFTPSVSCVNEKLEVYQVRRPTSNTK